MTGFDFGRRLRELRAKGELTQAQLGDRLGVTATAISHWERGRSQPQPAEIPAIAQALGVSVSEIFDQAQLLRRTGSGRTEQALLATLRRALDLGPEHVEINVYVRRADRGSAAESSAPEDYGPPRGLRFTRRVLQDWPAMSEDEQREWLELADELRNWRGSGDEPLGE